MALQLGYDDGSGGDLIVSSGRAVAAIRWGCDCCKDKDPLTPAEKELARLFCAAPDLLSACEGITSLLDSGLIVEKPKYHGEDAITSDVIGALRAAIAKAKGTP
jgi:hypothetical protein